MKIIIECDCGVRYETKLPVLTVDDKLHNCIFCSTEICRECAEQFNKGICDSCVEDVRGE